jgi:hypothetical protein
MINASTARTQTVSNSTVETELALININIFAAVANGQTTMTVGKTTQTNFNGNVIVGSPMTLSMDYYKVWQSSIVNNLIDAEMTEIIDTYTLLGYSISRKSMDGETISWQISW